MHLIWIVKCSCHILQEDKLHNVTRPSLTSHGTRTVYVYDHEKKKKLLHFQVINAIKIIVLIYALGRAQMFSLTL